VVVQSASRDRQSAMTEADALFAVLADGTRRAAVAALMAKPRTSSDLARELNVTPQALTRHLRMLRQVGLVKVGGDQADARLRIYRIEPKALEPLRGWLADAERLWSGQLAAFRDFAESSGE
jgi:DNA-binding transcriptional ArsR family regulator